MILLWVLFFFVFLTTTKILSLFMKKSINNLLDQTYVINFRQNGIVFVFFLAMSHREIDNASLSTVPGL